MEQKDLVSRNNLTKILRKFNLGHLKSSVRIKAGLINPTYLINHRFILRINKSEQLKKIPGYETRFERETFLYNLLPKKEIPTPTCLGFDDSGKIIPEKYIILSYIEGQSLTDSFKNYHGKTQYKLSFQMGRILRKIHDINPCDLKKFFGSKKGWKKLFQKEFDYYLKEAEKEKYFTDKVEKEIKKIYQKFQNVSSDLENDLSLVHGDFSASNIQVANGNIVGIFDFEWSHIADPLWDWQKLPINFQLGEQFNRANFLKGYGIKRLTEAEITRLKMYCLHQGMWEIWATKVQLFPFGKKEIAEGHQLINATINLRL